MFELVLSNDDKIEPDAQLGLASQIEIALGNVCIGLTDDENVEVACRPDPTRRVGSEDVDCADIRFCAACLDESP